MKSIWISKNGCNCIFTWAEILWSWLHNPKWRTLSLKSVLDHPNLGAPLPLWSFMGCCLSWFAAVFATDSQPLWSCFWAAVCADLLLLMLLFGLLFRSCFGAQRLLFEGCHVASGCCLELSYCWIFADIMYSSAAAVIGTSLFMTTSLEPALEHLNLGAFLLRSFLSCFTFLCC